MVDHIHMLITIPPKYAVSQVIGISKGKSTIQSPELLVGGRRTLRESISGAGYYVSTVGHR